MSNETTNRAAVGLAGITNEPDWCLAHFGCQVRSAVSMHQTYTNRALVDSASFGNHSTD